MPFRRLQGASCAQPCTCMCHKLLLVSACPLTRLFLARRHVPLRVMLCCRSVTHEGSSAWVELEYKSHETPKHSTITLSLSSTASARQRSAPQALMPLQRSPVYLNIINTSASPPALIPNPSQTAEACSYMRSCPAHRRMLACNTHRCSGHRDPAVFSMLGRWLKLRGCSSQGIRRLLRTYSDHTCKPQRSEQSMNALISLETMYCTCVPQERELYFPIVVGCAQFVHIYRRQYL